MPHFIITYGRTESGKGSLHRRLLERLREAHPEAGAINKENVYVADIDDYIESSEVYKLKVFDALKHFYRTAPENVEFDEFLRRKLQDFAVGTDNALGEELSDKMFLAYSKVKEDVRPRFLKDLKTAIRAEMHIMYELTSSNRTDPLGKFFDKGGLLGDIRDKYVVSIVFPYGDHSMIIHKESEQFLARVTVVKKIVEGAIWEMKNGSVEIAMDYLSLYKRMTPPVLCDARKLRTEKIAMSQASLVEYFESKHIQNVLLYDYNISKYPIVGFDIPTSRNETKKEDKINFLSQYGKSIHPLLAKTIVQSTARLIAI